MDLEDLVNRAREGDLAAYGRLVEATEAMVYAVARRIVRNAEDARDVTQETFLRAFRRLHDVREPAAFPGWLRRTAFNTATSFRRARRSSLADEPDTLATVPVLDESESRWTEAQRQSLSAALLTLDPDDRLLCDRFYHGGWTAARLAAELNLSDANIRKRLQRIRERLRKEIEMEEQRDIIPENSPTKLPAKIIELLAKPRLTSLPENPVGAIWNKMRGLLPDFEEIEVPEVVDEQELFAAFGRENNFNHQPGTEPLAHRIDESHFLRCEMDVPMLLALRGRSGPLSVAAAGKVYRIAKPDRTRLEAFHQGDLIVVQEGLGEWDFMPRLQEIISALLP
ncbi:MAG: polymerase sigma factor RpoE, partial [Phycisphaerales bacterium]|nr:polymerase sigma factor RpoE [Phycisphaerales bacterium]